MRKGELQKSPAVLLLVLVMTFAACSAMAEEQPCPSVTAVHDGIKKVFNRDFQVNEVVVSPIPGICEAHVLVQGRYNILYVDKTGRYFLAGNLIEVASGKNLTREKLQALNKLTSDDIKKLKDLVAFTLGKKGPEFFYVTDPQCPYCKKGLPIIERLAKEGKLKAHVLFYPLSFHRGAKEQAISIICDKKGIKGLESRYQSENQCEKGKKKVEETIALLRAKGVRGTPSYIFMNGKVHVGLIGSEDELLKQVMENGKKK